MSVEVGVAAALIRLAASLVAWHFRVRSVCKTAEKCPHQDFAAMLGEVRPIAANLLRRRSISTSCDAGRTSDGPQPDES
jgi:hypothetical protein